MKTCTFSYFIQTLKPWLNDDYIRKASFDGKGSCRLFFVDGGQKVFQIDECSEAQLKDIIAVMQKNSVQVENIKGND